MKPEEIDAKALAERTKQSAFAARLFCCASTGCLSSGSKTIQDVLKERLTAAGLAAKVQIVPTGCMGLCSLGPLIRIERPGEKDKMLSLVTPELAGVMVDTWLAPTLLGAKTELSPQLTTHLLDLDLPFFAKQVRVVLENSGKVNPESIDDYYSHDGYQALKTVLAGTPEAVIETIAASGLRGRGGAGFPTATKWGIARKAPGTDKVVICNGDEGDPGAYMDRSVLEGDPHAVIEGMLIAAYAIGANQGFFYIRAEYPLAVERVEKAIRQAKAAGFIGKDILGSGFSFSCEIRLGAGAFVCGEETALIASVEGRRGTPSPRPPFPAVKGLWGMPTCINNVETLANIQRIIRKGSAWFAGMGTEKSKGSKVFALTGKVKHNGLVEVPMGMTLREIVEDIGGGTASGKKVKIVQTGGPSGGMIPAEKLDSPVSYEHLAQLGSIMGSGGMIVMEEGDDVVELSKFYLEFTVDESCGKCAPCRIGGVQMLEVLNRILDGHGKLEDLATIQRLAKAMQKASLCGLGQTAPNPVLSALRYFENEFTRRITTPAPAAVGAK